MNIRKDYADTPAGQIHYRHVPGTRTGAGAGTAERSPLVFLHRTPASSAAFEPMMTAMAGDRPLYAFDTPRFRRVLRPARLPANHPLP